MFGHGDRVNIFCMSVRLSAFLLVRLFYSVLFFSSGIFTRFPICDKFDTLECVHVKRIDRLMGHAKAITAITVVKPWLDLRQTSTNSLSFSAPPSAAFFVCSNIRTLVVR